MTSSFTAYIFNTDIETLKANAGRGAKGILFGQWTSTGNPVVHVIKGREEAKTVESHLYQSYRLCKIGEFHAAAGNVREGRDRIPQVYSSQSGGAAQRFLFLDVGISTITPFLFTKQNTRGQVGKIEPLTGENPFNRRPVNRVENTPTSTNQPGYQPSAAHQQWQRSSEHASTQSQEVDVEAKQWYSDRSMLKFVLDKLKSLAEGGNVDISRDTQTHDLSVVFVDQHYGRSWVVEFPAKFPKDGATLTYTVSRSTHGRGSPLRGKQPNDVDPESAMRRIVRFITEKGPVIYT